MEDTMAEANNPKDQWILAIEEYLSTVNGYCLDRSRHGGRIKGYTAALLLLCVTDAMGHGLLEPNGQFTRLDVLQDQPFDNKVLQLDPPKIKSLTKLYRHKLVHTGMMMPNAFLKDEPGSPFEFDEIEGTPSLVAQNERLLNGPTLRSIRVPALYDVVEAAWQARDPSIFYPPTESAPPPSAEWISSLNLMNASGVVSLPGGAAD
jgi:hypothetical protein